jgi:hypothetical protein
MRSGTEQKDERPARPKKGTLSLRCCCGSLLARLLPDGVELKCRRCKRQIIIPLESRASM